MSSSLIQPVADVLKTTLEGLSLSPVLKVHVWARGDLTRVPAAEIELPTITRVLPDEAESQIGTYDWRMDWPVTIYYDLREPKVAQERLADALEKWIAAVDANPGLTGLALDAKVTSAERVYELQQNRTLVAYETTVSVIKLVP